MVVKHYIEIDPEGELRRHYTGCTECNCQTIAKKVYLNPDGSAAQLADKFGIRSNQNIYAVWRRHGEPILNRVFDNYDCYRNVLVPVLSGWLENVVDSTWDTVESIIGSDSPNLPWVFRDMASKAITMCKEINFGMVVGYPLALIVSVSPADDEFNIVLRVCPTGEQKFLPPNLQLIVFDDESGKFLPGDITTGGEKWTELQFSGIRGESFRAEIILGAEKFADEKFII